jgi:hypothetical protein
VSIGPDHPDYGGWFWQLRQAQRKRLIAAHPTDDIVCVKEQAELTDDQLVALIMERTGKDQFGAREILGIIRGGPPDGTIW